MSLLAVIGLDSDPLKSDQAALADSTAKGKNSLVLVFVCSYPGNISIEIMSDQWDPKVTFVKRRSKRNPTCFSECGRFHREYDGKKSERKSISGMSFNELTFNKMPIAKVLN